MASTFGFTLGDWRRRYKENPEQAAVFLHTHLTAIDPQDNAWLHRATVSDLRAQIEPLLATYLRNPTSLPLFGVPFAVKDNIDVAGWPTTAACPALTYTPATDAFVVGRLKAAGAIVIGKTNLDQYATGLVGVRSPFGAVRNTFDPAYISGGSSSGSASVVARGLVAFALGTDTAGSGRVPAAFNNIVGLKPTKGWLSAAGVVPACRLNDTVSVLALTVEDAFLVASLAAGYDSRDSYSRFNPRTAPAAFKAGPDLAVPFRAAMNFFGDAHAEAAWDSAVSRLRESGANIIPIDFAPFQRLAEELYGGPWVAERTVAVGDMLRRPDAMDSVVHGIVSSGAKYTAVEAYEAEYRRAELVRKIQETLAQVDALVVPTAPTIHTIASVRREPVLYNTQLGTYTNFVNLADLAALAVPGPFRPDGLPAGITLIAPAWHDRALAELGVRWQRALALPLGATNSPLPAPPTALPPSADHVRLAVVGEHLSGMPLNHLLTERRAVFVEETRTATGYRLFALSDGSAKRSRLLRDERGGAATVELWDVPLGRFGEFVMEVVGVGPVILEDGRVVIGLVSDVPNLQAAVEITEFGGWRNWITASGDGHTACIQTNIST